MEIEIGCEINTIRRYIGTLVIAGDVAAGGDTNKSDTAQFTISPTLYGAKTTDTVVTIYFTGGHSSNVENYGVGSHYTLTCADAVITLDDYNRTKLVKTIAAGNTSFDITVDIVNNPVLELDRQIVVSATGFAAIDFTIVDDNIPVTSEVREIIDVTDPNDGLARGLTALDKTGTNDCRANLQAMVNYLMGTPAGGILYFPNGTYKLLNTGSVGSQITCVDNGGDPISYIGESDGGVTIACGPEIAYSGGTKDTFWFSNYGAVYDNAADSSPISFVNLMFTVDLTNYDDRNEHNAFIKTFGNDDHAGKVLWRLENLKMEDSSGDHITFYNNSDWKIYNLESIDATRGPITYTGGWMTGQGVNLTLTANDRLLTHIDQENESPGYDNGNGPYETDVTFINLALYNVGFNPAPIDTSTLSVTNLQMDGDHDMVGNVIMLSDGTADIDIINSTLYMGGNPSASQFLFANPGDLTFTNCDLYAYKSSDAQTFAMCCSIYWQLDVYEGGTATGQRVTFTDCNFDAVVTGDKSVAAFATRGGINVIGSQPLANDQLITVTNCTFKSGLTAINYYTDGSSAFYGTKWIFNGGSATISDGTTTRYPFYIKENGANAAELTIKDFELAATRLISFEGMTAASTLTLGGVEVTGLNLVTNITGTPKAPVLADGYPWRILISGAMPADKTTVDSLENGYCLNTADSKYYLCTNPGFGADASAWDAGSDSLPT